MKKASEHVPEEVEGRPVNCCPAPNFWSLIPRWNFGHFLEIYYLEHLQDVNRVAHLKAANATQNGKLSLPAGTIGTLGSVGVATFAGEFMRGIREGFGAIGGGMRRQGDDVIGVSSPVGRV